MTADHTFPTLGATDSAGNKNAANDSAWGTPSEGSNDLASIIKLKELQDQFPTVWPVKHTLQHRSPVPQCCQHRDVRCGLHPARCGPGCKTRLESRIQKCNPLLWMN